MKSLTKWAAIAVLATATTAQAGSMADPIVETDPFVEATGSSAGSSLGSGGIGAIAAAVVLIGLVVAASDGT